MANTTMMKGGRPWKIVFLISSFYLHVSEKCDRALLLASILGVRDLDSTLPSTVHVEGCHNPTKMMLFLLQNE